MRISGKDVLEAAAAASLLLTLGCAGEDARVNKLTVGITKDSAIAAMGTSPSQNAPYLINGKYIETLYFTRPGKTDSLSKTLRRMDPVVTVAGKVTGWGWKYWDSVATANHIDVPPAEK